MADTAVVLQTTASWVESFVIGLNLCPFAASPLRAGRLRLCVYEGQELEALAHRLVEELMLLDTRPAQEVATTLLIHPEALLDFEEYLDFLEQAEGLLITLGLEGELQLASFHPDYCFEGSEPDDHANYTNRSPYPMVHLLREADVSLAVERYPGIERVPAHNVRKLRAMSLRELRQHLPPYKN